MTRGPITIFIRSTALFSGSGNTYTTSIGSSDELLNVWATSTSPTKPERRARTCVCSSGSVFLRSVARRSSGSSPGSVRTTIGAPAARTPWPQASRETSPGPEGDSGGSIRGSGCSPRTAPSSRAALQPRSTHDSIATSESTRRVVMRAWLRLATAPCLGSPSALQELLEQTKTRGLALLGMELGRGHVAAMDGGGDPVRAMVHGRDHERPVRRHDVVAVDEVDER